MRKGSRIVGRKECLEPLDCPWGAARWPRLGVLGCCPACHLSRRKPMTTKSMAQLAVLLAFGAMLALPAGAAAQEIIRVGAPTKTYFPTILATVAKEKGLFEKEGLRPEITIYRGGGETFEAIAANSADLGPVAVPLVATSRKRGVLVKIVGGNGDEWSGWILGVKTASPIKAVKELDGKKVGITSAGSGTDTLALWAQSEAKVTFQRVGVGSCPISSTTISPPLSSTRRSATRSSPRARSACSRTSPPPCRRT